MCWPLGDAKKMFPKKMAEAVRSGGEEYGKKTKQNKPRFCYSIAFPVLILSVLNSHDNQRQNSQVPHVALLLSPREHRKIRLTGPPATDTMQTCAKTADLENPANRATVWHSS